LSDVFQKLYQVKGERESNGKTNDNKTGERGDVKRMVEKRLQEVKGRKK
jgi:hypothetical protein